MTFNPVVAALIQHLQYTTSHLFDASIMPSNEQVQWGHALNQLASRCINVLAEDLVAVTNHIHRLQTEPQAFAYESPQVIVALATLQHSVQDLSRAYIQ